MMKNKSLFSPGNLVHPFRVIDRLLNPYSCSIDMDLDNNPFTVRLTRRARASLDNRQQPLLAEMQLYFSCVVKKRVLFHDETQDFRASRVTDNLDVAFNTVEASSCDPVEFAMHYPARRILDSDGALKMHPRCLLLDYSGGKWSGEFQV